MFTDANKNFSYTTTSGKSSTLTTTAGTIDNTTISVDVTAPKNNGSFNASLSFSTHSGTTIGIGAGAAEINLSSITNSYNTSGTDVTDAFPITVSVGSSVPDGTYTFDAIAISDPSGMTNNKEWTFEVKIGSTPGSIGTVSVAAQSGVSVYGSASTPTFAVTSSRSGNGTVNGTYSVSGLPAGVTSAGFTPSATFTAGGSTSFPDVTLTLNVPANLNAGSYDFTVLLSDGGTPATTTGTLVVNKKSITVTADDRNKTYGDAVTFLGTEFSTPVGALVNGDAISSVTLNSDGAAASATVTSPGPTYDIVASAATGTGLDNYNISYSVGTLTVGVKSITVTADDRNKTYGDAVTFLGTEFSTPVGALVNGDAISSVTLNSDGAAASATVTSPGPTYDIVASAATGTGLDNYNISYSVGTLTVGVKSITVTADDRNKTYGDAVTFLGTEFSTPVGALVNGDAISSVTLNSDGAAASATVTSPGPTYDIVASAATGTGLDNYNISYSVGTLTVGVKSITVTADDRNKTYGDAVTFLGTEFSTPVGALVNGDAISSVTLNSDGAAASATVTSPGPTYDIVASAATGTGLDNYNISYSVGTLTVGVKSITVTADDRNKTYGDAVTFLGTEFSTPVGALVNGDAISSVTLNSDGAAASATVTSPGPTYDIVASAATGTGLDNYNISYSVGTLTVGVKSITVTADDRNKTYGDAVTFLGTEFSTPVGALVNGDAISSVTLNSDGAAASATVTSPGPTYDIVASAATGTGLDNYNISYSVGTLTVGVKSITVTADDRNKTYGDAVTFLGTEFSTPVGALVNGDAISSVTLNSDGAAASATVTSPGPTYDIVASAATGTGLDNYNISYSVGTLTVGVKSITVTADDRNKTYGDAVTFLGTEFSTPVGALVNGDAISSVTLNSDGAAASATVTSPGPTYDIVASAATGTGLDNYNISYSVGTLTVGVKSITVTADDRNKTYGDAVTFLGTEFSTPVGALVNGDAISSVTLNSDGAAASATVTSPGPTYDIVASAATGTGLDNYNISYSVGTLTVGVKSITVTADDRNKTYGDAVTFLGTEFSTPVGALVNGDAISSVTLNSDGAAASATVTSPGPTYDIVASAATGTGLDNYNISYSVGTLTVGVKSITVTADDRNKTYGDAVTFLGTEFSTPVGALVNGDAISSVTLNSDGAAASATVTSPGPTYDIVASAATGTGLDNYNISYSVGTLTVGVKSITVTADDRNKTYGDAVTFLGTEFSTPVGALVNGDAISSVTLNSDGAAASATVTSPGPTYDIVASAATGTGLDNYNISYSVGTLTVGVKPITVTADDRNKTYGDAVTFLGTEFSTPVGALVNGDAISSVTLNSDGAAASATVTSPGPTYDIVASAATGSGLGNYNITYHNGTLTINQKDASVTPDALSKYCGMPDPTFTGTLSGFLDPDNVTATYSRTPGESGNTYTISATLSPTSVLDNYNITYNTADFTINVLTQIDASASSNPVALGTNAVLSATVTPQIEGITIYFTLDDGNGNTSTYTAVTDNSGTATTAPISGLTVNLYKVIAQEGVASCVTSTPAYLPVYDPNGSFITGGGWIVSPAGALVSKPSATGKANFGFNAKYKKGNNQVDGNTEFQFQQGDFNFKSSSLDAGTLVISGAKGTYRGVGTVNGAGDYGFMVSAVDGQVNGGGGTDLFRIKIWDRSHGNTPVYDNNMGEDENGDPTIALGGGSIVIHYAKGKNSTRIMSSDITTSPVEVNSNQLEQTGTGKLTVKVAPNPTSYYFTAGLQSLSKENVNMVVTDITGRVIEQRTNIATNSTIQFGGKYRPGTYIAQFLQGTDKVTVMLIKEGE